MSERLKLKLDGEEYELALPTELTMAEHRRFEQVAGIGVGAIAELEETFRAGVIVAWMAVSIQRSKPHVRFEKIVARLDELTMEDVKEAWEQIDTGEQNPPAVTPPESGRSESTTQHDSAKPSVPTPVESLPGTGDPGSDGSALDPVRLGS